VKDILKDSDYFIQEIAETNVKQQKEQTKRAVAGTKFWWF
jgi:hypothetical protein